MMSSDLNSGSRLLVGGADTRLRGGLRGSACTRDAACNINNLRVELLLHTRGDLNGSQIVVDGAIKLILNDR